MKNAIARAYAAVRDRGTLVEPSRWQSIDVSKRPEAATHEVLNYTLQAMLNTEDVDQLARDIEPNMPWAEDHFDERVLGQPLNPGEEWARWPWGNSANSFRRVKDVPQQNGGLADGFDHSYMERMWPKYANGRMDHDAMTGIRYPYGDARDVVDHLAQHPGSRQAYLPIWFPEDTGKTDVRVPCTLGYHFIMRHGFFHCTYYIRSCDLYRHFRDDVYLTARLQLWMLDQLRLVSPFWLNVKLGMLTMHIVSLHCFVNDARLLWPDKK